VAQNLVKPIRQAQQHSERQRQTVQKIAQAGAILNRLIGGGRAGIL
jgi:hypothetical protein